MSTNQLIVFGDDWNRHPSSSQHLVRELLSDYEVIWVNSIGMRSPTLSWYDFVRIWKRFVDYLTQKSSLNKKLDAEPIVISPLTLPWHSLTMIQALNKKIIRRQLQAFLSQECKRILWISNPLSDYLQSVIQPDCLIYYCGDDFTSFPDIDPKQVEAAEAELYKRAHLIIFASESLKKKRAIRCTGTVLHVPHGVSDSRFVKKANTPDLIENKVGPLVGYVGIFEDWIDVDLLCWLIEQRPELDFCLIGDTRSYTKQLQSYPNVILTGQLPHNDLPGYLQFFDLGLLLYRESPMTKAINPLKLYEYFAQGIPVLSTLSFSGISGFENVVVADSRSEFLRQLDIMVNIKSQTSERLIEVAKNNSWSVRAKIIRKQLERLDKV